MRSRPILAAGLPVAFVLIALACLSLSRTVEGVAAIWPVNAIAFAISIRWARRPIERVYVLGAYTAAMMLANHLLGAPLTVTLCLPVIGLAEILLAIWLVRGDLDPCAGVKDFATFFAGPVVIAPVVSGVMAAVACAALSPGAEPVKVFVDWALADGLGMVIAGSFMLIVGRPMASIAPKGENLRFLVAAGVLTLVSVPVMLIAAKPPLGVIFPLVIITAMSHRQLGAVTGVAIFAIFSIAGATTGHGPAAVANMADLDAGMVTQLAVASMAFSVLPISSLVRRLDSLAAEAQAARAKAEELSEIKTRLLAHVSHEIRSPLAGVTTLAELMRDGALGQLSPSQLESINQIAASGAAVAELARDLTDAAAVQSGKASIRLAETSVAEAVNSAVEQARFRAVQYDAEIEIAAGGAEVERVWADPLRLRQILVNLLVNGAKYGGAPARVRITAYVTPQNRVRFEVSDNGAGIDAEKRSRLFQDFDRLGAERRDLDGAGLGLALSREMARLQNGQLGVHGQGELGGACFWVELPLAERVVQAEASAA